MITTPNMSLTRWDLEADPYDHSQLSENFHLLDLHRHVTGEGRKIPTGGIENDAITAALIAAGAVTTSEILDNTIVPGDLSTALWDYMQPLGTLLTWWRPSGSVPDPETSTSGRWVLADGRTLSTAQHDYDTAYSINTSITILDARNQYLLGAVLSGGGSGTGTAPNIGGTAGANALDLTHTHSVNPHTHTIAGHTHTISSDGSHTHLFYKNSAPGSPQSLQLRDDLFSANSGIPVSYLVLGSNPLFGAESVPITSNGTHNHTGTTGNTSQTTDASSGATTSSPVVSQAATDNRPNSVGAAVFVKVRY